MTIGWSHTVSDADEWDGFNDSGIEHFSGNKIMHLAREICQNALDAALSEDSEVKIKFCLDVIDVEQIPDIDEFRNTIKRCLAVSDEESPKALQFFQQAEAILSSGQLKILRICDYNTRGMRGPCKNGTPYYAFMKAKGQSKKTSETAGGSYGIGKNAPFTVSSLRTIFVSTIFEDTDGGINQLTQGKSILMSHYSDDDPPRTLKGAGYWGVIHKCQPISGAASAVADVFQRSKEPHFSKELFGTTITILAFDDTPKWREELALYVLQNYFGAILDGRLCVDVDGQYVLNRYTIKSNFEDATLESIAKENINDGEQFECCRNYFRALLDGEEVIVRDTQMNMLGHSRIRIIVGEKLEKKVCILRNGMFITETLPGLKSFSDFKEFIAVFQCLSKSGNQLLRGMEPPKHDAFEPERLPSHAEQAKGKKALKEIHAWVRTILKEYAKDPVAEVTTLDELKDFFGDESGSGAGGSGEDINPFGGIVIQPKPIRTYVPLIKVKTEEDGGQDGGEAAGEGVGGEGDGGLGDGQNGEGGGGGQGKGGGDGEGGKGQATGGEGGGDGSAGPSVHSALIAIQNFRSVPISRRNRRIAFTPSGSGRVFLKLLEAGADADFGAKIVRTDTGILRDNGVVLDVKQGERCVIEVELSGDFIGAMKVVTHEIR